LLNRFGTVEPCQTVGVLATEPRWLIDDDLVHKLDETARAQSRTPSDVVTEAVRKYLDEPSWLEFVESNEARARANGITEEDVDRLISEVRAESRLGR
jgi:predicted transcriptional regulator